MILRRLSRKSKTSPPASASRVRGAASPSRWEREVLVIIATEESFLLPPFLIDDSNSTTLNSSSTPTVRGQQRSRPRGTPRSSQAGVDEEQLEQGGGGTAEGGQLRLLPLLPRALSIRWTRPLTRMPPSGAGLEGSTARSLCFAFSL